MGRQIIDFRLADVRLMMLVFYADSACNPRMFFILKKTYVVGSLRLPTDEALESCPISKLFQ